MSLELQDVSQEFENSYRLSSMQQGMLLHALLHPGAGIDIEQLVLDLCERLDPVRFRQSWLQVMARHAVLRTRLRWINLKDPVQDVCEKAPLNWAEKDWTSTPANERRARLLRLLDSDRRRGFDLNAAPLWRLTLIRFGASDWQLVWTFHHAILDGRSYALLLKEVFEDYGGRQAENAVRHTEAPPYSDYIAWLGQQDFDRSEAFWRQRLEGFQAATPVAIDQVSRVSGEQSHDRAPEELTLSAADTSALRAVADEAKVTINTIVQGAWAIVLSFYSLEEDIVFGVVRSSRPEALSGSGEMIGLFLNTLPMRIRVDPVAELIPWLREVRTQWSLLRPHEHTPLARIQAWSSLRGRSPLFESTVMYERYQLDAVLREQTGGAVRKSDLFLQTNNKLDFAAYDGAELRLRLDYDHTCIERQLARRLLVHAGNVLQSIAGNPHRTIGSLRLIDDAERTELLTRWNNAAAVHETAGSLDEMVWRQITLNPDSVAITHGDAGLSYRELGQRASLLAGHLRNKGLSPGTLAAILLDRSIDSAVSALAVLMTGAAYIPIDSSCPPHRLEAILDDAKPLILIRHGDLARSSPPNGGPVIVTLDGFDWMQSCEPDDRLRTDSEQPAYLIYTSGSTGRSKAVAVPHRAIVNHMRWMQQTFELGAHDRVLQLTSFGFDVAVWEIFGTMSIGGCLVIPSDKDFDLARTVDTIVREQITVLQLVPSLLRVLVSAPGFANCRSLRHVFCGGEPMPDDLPGRFYGKLPAAWLHNMYGPTETTIDALHFSVPCDWTAARVPIGLPILNTQAYVLDIDLEPVPVGVPGELHIGGSQLALGYHRQPALTSERFVDDPFSALAGARLYKTGDIVRRRADGNIEFLSRRDDQFKIRGVRGELGEIEAVLLQFPDVRDCAVILGGGDNGDKQLLAFVVLIRDGTVEPLGRFLRSRLVVQHLPTIVTVSSIPRSPNGKVDRARLPSPLQTAAGELPVAAYGSPTEETLARIWRELLKREHIEADGNFFDLGGESLLAVRLAYIIEETMGVRLGIPEIFKSPILCEMAQLLSTRGSPMRPDVLPIQEGSPAECSIYFIYAGSHEFGLAHMLGAKSTVYGVEAGWPSSWRQALERGDTSGYPTMEELVDPFCSTILAHAGSKPVVVAGYSFAGLMAFETARQLEKRGASIGGVLLFDTVARNPSLVRVAWNEVKDFWRGKSRFGWATLGQAARTVWKTTQRDARPTSPHTRRESLAPGDADARELSLSWPLMERLYQRIRMQYRPRKLSCPGILVVANSDEETRLRRSARPDLGWSRFFAGDLEIISAEGDHSALPRAYSRALENKLVAALDRLK